MAGHYLAHDMTDLMRDIAGASGRHLAVPGTLNFRDVGGYPVTGGGIIGWRRLFRSDALHRLDLSGTGLLAGLGLRTVLDLRTNAETQLAPSPLDDFAERGTLTMHISLIGEDFSALPAELGDIYSFMIDERGAAIGAAIRSLARPGALPGLVHCTAGKDRTGVVVAFMLAVAGVPDHLIAADYALSSMYLDPESTPTIGHVRASSGLGDRLTAALLASPPDLIRRGLDRARQRAGSIAGYLGRHGVSEAELSALRAALVTHVP
ncbi:MAG TPA: tyrosine-protein phosphatase [Streptosporangiaceae bacterium]|nr:tyrosine-protein phosphatase [Streptosporangiaceae bacterium]